MTVLIGACLGRNWSRYGSLYLYFPPSAPRKYEVFLLLFYERHYKVYDFCVTVLIVILSGVFLNQFRSC